MWLSKKLLGAGKSQPAAREERFSAGPKEPARPAAFRMCAPWGIAWSPPDLAQAFFVQGETGRVCVGALLEEDSLEPGELLLFSAGGARIWLKNNGEVEINGRVFSADSNR